MDALGHRRFAMVGHDVGMVTAYALAADHPDRIDRLAVAEAVLFGVTPSPPLIGATATNNRLWHVAFNRLAEVNEELVRGREDIFFGYEFAIQGGEKINLPMIAAGDELWLQAVWSTGAIGYATSGGTRAASHGATSRSSG